MAKSAEASMNVSALKLADPYVKEILDTAAHVALYNFNPDVQEWEKTNVEGALFLYCRTGEPKYNAFILNRLSTINKIEPIDDGLDLHVQAPFLLYRNSEGNIHSVWFYDREECVRIAKSVEKLVLDVKKNLQGVPDKSTCLKNSPVSLNISNSQNNVGNSIHQQTPPDFGGGECTNKRVRDFFAKAISKAPLPASSSSNVFRSPRTPQQPVTPRQESLGEVNSLLQRLMSNPANQPVQTVQDIEKQHSALRKSKKDIARPLSLSLTPQAKLENGLSYLRLNESPTKGFTPTSAISTQHFFNSSLAVAPTNSSGHSPSSSSEQPLEVSVLERSVTGLETPTKPALLPPVMFTTTPKDESRIQPEPLTKTQLLQAVSYLLKNDADFVKKLHEAYVKSFVDMVS